MDRYIFPLSASGGGGGEQPQLFAPVVTGGVNSISWANNPDNGGFEVTLTADVDGTQVTSPLTITQAMDGSTLTITASATNFESNSTIIQISYMDAQSLISMTGYSGLANKCTWCVYVPANARTYEIGGDAIEDGTTYSYSSNYNCYLMEVPIGNTPKQFSFKMKATDTIARLTTSINNTGRTGWYSGVYTHDADYCTTITTFSASWYINGTLVASGQSQNSYSCVITGLSVPVTVDDIITLIVNITY